MRFKHILVAAIMLGVAAHAAAQDIHFSQPDVNPILFNPAYSGFFSGSGRFAVTYRNQWASVTQAFQTIAANGEYALSRRRYQRDGVSLGAAFFSDRAGTLNYGTTAATAVLSYYKSLNRYNNNFLSCGLSLGFAQSGFDPAQALMRDDEAFARATLLYPLFGLGVAWFCQPHEHFYIKTALSGQNLNRPALSYTGEAPLGEHPAYLERRYNMYLRAEYRVAPSLAVQPLLAVQMQRNNSEVVVGTDMKWYLAELVGKGAAVSAGVAVRHADAIIFSLTTEWTSLLFSFAYDSNFSKLVPASHGVGAFEASLVYHLSRSERVKRKALPCPII